MPENIRSSLRLYARQMMPQRIAKILQEDINRLQEWANCWLMKFNPIKCEYLMVTNESLPLPTQYCINNVMIRQVPHAEYFGV